MKNLFLLTILLFTFSCQKQITTENVEIKVISAEEFSENISNKQVQLLDVRTAEEFAEGHIANAKNIDVLQEENFVKEIQDLNKNQPIYIYCRSGKRSANAAEILEENGFVEIIDLNGGYTAWGQNNE